MHTTRHASRAPALRCRRRRRATCAQAATVDPPSPLPPYPGDAAPPAALTAWRTATTRTITAFMLPTAAIPLCDPLLTLVDVSVVGRCAPTVALAALGPNSQIFTFIGYVLTGLNAAVVAEVATALRAGDKEKAGQLTAAALAVATGVGCAATCVLLTAGPTLIAATGAPLAVRDLALSYLTVRALACPLTLITAVSQAALLAARNPRTPLAAVGIQIAVNIVLDIVLVAHLGAGLPGAAAATVAAQVAGTVILVAALARSGAAAPTLRGLRAAFSRNGSAVALRATGSAVTAVHFAVAAYWLIQGGANGLPSTAAVAAHQPVWQAWTTTSFAHTPLEAAALAFVPTARSQEERTALVRLIMFRLAAVVGVATAAIAAGAALAPALFTADPSLHPTMAALAPQAALATLVCAADVAASGALISLRRPGALVRSMLVAAASVAAARFGAIATGRDSLAGVWWALVVFFVARAAGSVGSLVLGGDFRRQVQAAA